MKFLITSILLFLSSIAYSYPRHNWYYYGFYPYYSFPYYDWSDVPLQGVYTFDSTETPSTTVKSTATVQINCPINAKVWVQGVKINQIDGHCQIETTDSIVELKAKWKQNDKHVEQTRTIYLHPGAFAMVNFY